MRLTITRATSGFSGLVSQRASQSLRPVVRAVGRGGSGCLRGQDGGHARLDDGARPGRVAALEDVGHGGLRPVLSTRCTRAAGQGAGPP